MSSRAQKAYSNGAAIDQRFYHYRAVGFSRSTVRTMQAVVALIRALGGGWTMQELPSEKQTLPFGPQDYALHGSGNLDRYSDPALQ